MMKKAPRQPATDFITRPRLVTHAKMTLPSLSDISIFSYSSNMESLDNTEWDVLIVGTGLQQSLLALYVPYESARVDAI